MSWKKLFESIKESLNDHMRLRNEYLAAENRILRNQIDGRLRLTDNERKELAEIGAKLGKKALADIATIAQPDTILAWNRKFANQKVATAERPKSVGRPRIDPETEEWVVRMARENRSWGYDRIQGGLNHLGYTISDQTVGNILKRHGISPAPERGKTVTWREFIRSHLDVLVAAGFFNSEMWSWFGLAMSCLLSFIHFSHHQVQSASATLPQQMLTLQALLRWSLGLGFQRRRWVHVIAQRSRVRQVGKTIVEQTWSEFEFEDARQRQSQNKGKVIPFTAARPGLIRDGPRDYRQWLDEWVRSEQREAA